MKKELKVRANRSGIGPGVAVGLGSSWLLFYDEQHWHLVHHLIGKYSGFVALAIVAALVALVFTLFRRKPGYVSISSKEEGE